MSRQVSGAYDVLVLGAGHAGCEAALAAARLGARVGVCTMDLTAIAEMPCNPAIGGPGKAHLVREIDAMGGAMGMAADIAAMQVRLLNTGKGPAVQALRVLADKGEYACAMRQAVERVDGIELIAAEALEILAPGGQIVGVETRDGRTLTTKALVLAAGVYLDSATFVGSRRTASGPGGRALARGLSHSLRQLGLGLGRFKTGTSPRVDLGSVDLQQLRAEPGLAEAAALSHRWRHAHRPPGWRPPDPGEQVCWAAYTNETTHSLIAASIGESPLFDGTIAGTGPRHCPSIEDKVHRFPERVRHPIWLEREARSSDQLYVLGMSTSLPEEIQLAVLRTLPGLARARIVTPGYAIEYDYLLSGQLLPTMELKALRGVFAAGQICGTSGYEEAAALGLIAGTNAARQALGQEPVVWQRTESYLGVLADDLATRDVSEPYRMMTARAEHRLHLRHTNADLRLTAWAHELGLVDATQANLAAARRQRLTAVQSALVRARIRPGEVVDAQLRKIGTTPLRQGARAWSLLGRPQVRYEQVCGWVPGLPDLDFDDRHELEATAKYGGYIRQQERVLARQRKMASRLVPADLDYAAVPGLASRAMEHLARVRPLTLGQAERVEGVTSADLAVLAGFLRRRGSDK